MKLNQYLDEIKPYWKDVIINLQKSVTWKIQLAIAISSKNVDEERPMHSKSNNIEFMPYNNANQVANELSKSLVSRYQIDLETSMRRSDFIFYSVHLLYHKCPKINFKRGRSYVDSPDSTKK